MAIASIQQLHDELLERIKEVPAFKNSGFSVFDVEDLTEASVMQDFPIAGAMYDGAVPTDKGQGGNAANPVANASHAAATATMQFTVVIAIQYHYSGQDDTKPQATALLDDLRQRIMGYKGVNSRPWRWMGEKPEPVASGDGLAFYSQVWQTVVPVVGTFNNS